MQKAFYGPAKSAVPLPDLSARELSILVVLAALLIGLGVYPQPVFDTSVASMQFLNSVYSQSVLPTVPTAGW